MVQWLACLPDGTSILRRLPPYQPTTDTRKCYGKLMRSIFILRCNIIHRVSIDQQHQCHLESDGNNLAHMGLFRVLLS